MIKGHFHHEEFGVNWRLGLRQTPRTYLTMDESDTILSLWKCTTTMNSGDQDNQIAQNPCIGKPSTIATRTHSFVLDSEVVGRETDLGACTAHASGGHMVWSRGMLPAPPLQNTPLYPSRIPLLFSPSLG